MGKRSYNICGKNFFIKAILSKWEVDLESFSLGFEQGTTNYRQVLTTLQFHAR